METWYELKAREKKTDAEKIVVVCVEAIHESKTMDTESEEKTYNNLCARVGVEIDGENETPLDEGTGDGETDPSTIDPPGTIDEGDEGDDE